MHRVRAAGDAVRRYPWSVPALRVRTTWSGVSGTRSGRQHVGVSAKARVPALDHCRTSDRGDTMQSNTARATTD